MTAQLDPRGHLGARPTPRPFPVTPDAYDPVGPIDSLDGAGYVLVVDPTGSEILYGTYLTAAYAVNLDDVLVDSSGALVVSGSTRGFNFPTTPGAFDRVINPGNPEDLFVTRFSPDRRRIEYSTFLGGSDEEDPFGTGDVALALAPDGDVVVVSDGISQDYPVTEGAFQPVSNGYDGVVTRLTLLPSGVERFGSSTAGCLGPLVLSVTSVPALFSTDFAVTCTNAPPLSTSGWMAISLGRLTTALELSGASAWIDPRTLVRLMPLRANLLGYAELDLALLQDPGVPIHMQAFWQDPCAPLGWSASNALSVVIQ